MLLLCELLGALSVTGACIVEAAAAVVEHIVVSIVMGVAALSIVMPRRVAHIVVVAANNGEVIVTIVMGRLQRVGIMGFFPNCKHVTDLIQIKIINRHCGIPFLCPSVLPNRARNCVPGYSGH
jgi:hypothetical protein